MSAKPAPYFTEDAFKFLRQLARNNNRDWFTANKPAYESVVRGPCLRLIADMAEPLQSISPELRAIAKPMGGSLFRIYRDTRFSGNKSPYKTHAGIWFSHAAASRSARGDAGNAAPGRLDAPGLYLNIEPGNCFLGGGIWHPQTQTTRLIRDYMLSNPASWKKATREPKFLKVFTLGGESLVRPPKGYDAAHELVDDLKRKDFIATAALDDADLLRPNLVALLMTRYALMAPMLDWLCGALDLDF